MMNGDLVDSLDKQRLVLVSGEAYAVNTVARAVLCRPVILARRQRCDLDAGATRLEALCPVKQEEERVSRT
jgi:hypothetical protein